ncbi:hypothetical protein [Nocardia sp. CDC160]|uniref:hypothetical protein n=1 Tax=Nocardia sp. CDC160 TaxID=3112166 RepID=UPI002DB63060|nr:hypothetical protein [Nocardia sp. CDC160]MEC3913317.1 hypothetical protein [Nocardia sp. CDC160]
MTGAPNVGRITGFLLIAAAVLTVAVLFLPMATNRWNGNSWDMYVWKSVGHGSQAGDNVFYWSAVPYALMVIIAGVVGVLLAAGMGARRALLFWAAAFAAGLMVQIASGDVAGYAQRDGGDTSQGPGFWVVTLVMLVACAALVTTLRDAVISKHGAVQGTSTPPGGAADRVTGVFLLIATVVALLASRLPMMTGHRDTSSVWSMGDGSIPLPAAQFVLGLLAVLVIAIALLAGGGMRNPAMRACGGTAAAIIFGYAISALTAEFSMNGVNFWEYSSTGFWAAAVAMVLAFAATVAGLVAQLARPRMVASPGMGHAPGFAAHGFTPAPNPFAQTTPPNPFAPAVAAPNPFAPASPVPNPFAPVPNVEATVKLPPQPPRMAKVYDGKDAEGRPVVGRAVLEGNLRTAVLAYLESAPVVLAARSFEEDEFAPGDRDVPLTFRTDGVWVWAGAVAHYLHKHGLPPEEELVRHITARGFRVGEVSEAAQRAAVQVITAG